MAKTSSGSQEPRPLPIDFKQLSDKALDHVTDLVFISDPLTKEILFINKAFSEATGIKSPTGCTCFNTIRKRDSPCANCQNIRAFENGFQITHNNLHVLDKVYAMKSSSIELGDKTYNLNILTEKQHYQQRSWGLDTQPVEKSSLLAALWDLFCKHTEEPNLLLFHISELFSTITDAATVSIYEPQKLSLHNAPAYLRTVFYARDDQKDISDPPEQDLPAELIRHAFTLSEPFLYSRTTLTDLPALQKYFNPDLMVVQAFPLVQDQRTVGLLLLKNPRPDRLESQTDYLHLMEVSVRHHLSCRQKNSKLYQLQNFDHLTMLYNRKVLMQDLVEYDQQQRLGVVLANINGLKHLNHFEGLSEGDKAIVQTAELIKQLVGDKATIYRVSGDEFAMVFCDLRENEFRQQANALSLLLGQKSSFSAAVGSAYTEKQGQFSSLLRKAQTDMFLNKREFYRQHPINERYRNDKDALLNLLSVDKISELIENHSFSLSYQPKYSLQRYRVSGAEALIRLKLDGQVIAASEFIPTLDAAHLTYLIDYFVLDRVCAKLRARLDQGLKIVPVSCNLSHHTMIRQDFTSRIKSIFEQYQIPYRLIPLEISERAGNLYHKELIDACITLATHGFILTIDDFGLAQANMLALADLPVSEIKFDKKLVDSLSRTNNFKIVTILNVMITLCNKMHIKTIAEGADKKEQIEILEKLGCNEIQGFYFSRPVPEDAFYRLL